MKGAAYLNHAASSPLPRRQPGDNVVFPSNDYPGVIYAALDLARRGVEVRQAPVGTHLNLDRRTRAVVVSHVHWQTGHRIDLVQLGSACRAAGARSVVDAIQSVGVNPIDLAGSEIDVLIVIVTRRSPEIWCREG